MYHKISQLRFLIGLFFSIVALILAVTAWAGVAGRNLNLYTALAFLIFGLAMMFVKDAERVESAKE